MKKHFIVICLCLIGITAHAQIAEWTFDDSLEGWTSNNISGLSANWLWQPDGKADAGPQWGTLPAIRSISEGGAAVMDADFFVNGGPMETNLIVEFDSPDIDLTASAGQPLHLKFHQFFKHNVAESILNVYDGANNLMGTMNVNAGLGVEFTTSSMDAKIIDLQALTGGEAHAIERIQFVYLGEAYFWIIDDIQIYEEEPVVETFPLYVGETLSEFGYPWANDYPESSWAYVPNQVVIQFDDIATFDEIQAIRDTLGAVLIDSCVCNKLQVWEIGDGGIYPNSMFDPTIDINEKVKGARTQSKVQGIDYNRYNYDELIPNVDTTLTDLVGMPSGISLASPTATRIAILDTGIDYNHPYLQNYIFGNNQTQSTADADNCQENDYIGWNFVDNNNNPYDDHSHGTHVAGIVVRSMRQKAPGCEFTIIPYKTHDRRGVSTLFNVACGHYQAMKDSARVINDSWGFYGDNSEIMDLVFGETVIQDVVVVASAGNDTVDLDSIQGYPACHPSPNLISVGAFGKDGALFNTDYANFSSSYLDIVALGEVKSTLPGGIEGLKTGTSMAAPAVSAAAVAANSSGTSYQEILDCIFNGSYSEPIFNTAVDGGKVLDWQSDCLKDICGVPVRELDVFKSLNISPNPASSELFIDMSQIQAPESVSVANQNGQHIYKKKLGGYFQSNPLELDIMDWPSGIYFITIVEKGYIWHAKFVKIE